MFLLSGVVGGDGVDSGDDVDVEEMGDGVNDDEGLRNGDRCEGDWRDDKCAGVFLRCRLGRPDLTFDCGFTSFRFVAPRSKRGRIVDKGPCSPMEGLGGVAGWGHQIAPTHA